MSANPHDSLCRGVAPSRFVRAWSSATSPRVMCCRWPVGCAVCSVEVPIAHSVCVLAPTEARTHRVDGWRET